MSKTVIIAVRVSPAQKKLLEKRAKTDNRPVSAWIRLAALKAASVTAGQKE